MKSFDFPLLMLPFIIAIVVLIWISSFAYQRRKQSKEAIALFYLSCGVILWIGAYVLAQVSRGVQTQYFWYQWVRLGVVYASVLIFIFALRHSHRDNDVRRWHFVLSIPTSIITLLLIIQMVHGQLFSPAGIQYPGGIINPEDLGLVGNLVLVYGFVLTVGAAFILGRTYFEAQSHLRWQGVVLVLGVLMPVVISFYTDILGNELIPNFDEATFSLVFTAIIFAWILFRQQLLNIWPVAYEMILHNMRDGVIILNPDNKIIMVNPAGELVIGQPGKDVLGKAFQDLAVMWGMGEIAIKVLQEKPVEFSLPGDAQVLFQMKITEMRDKNGRTGGRFVLINDISEMKRSQKRLTEMATIDFLTGIFNRQHFINQAEEELLHCTNNRRSCAIILLDVDLFKTVNDTYGHQVGDQVLKHIVDVCRSSIRRVDIMGRYGGEEFVILLPESPLEGALLVAERVRLAVAQSAFAVAQENILVTVSLGVAISNPDEFMTLDQLLEQADQALYLSKNGGRNRVSVYSG